MCGMFWLMVVMYCHNVGYFLGEMIAFKWAINYWNLSTDFATKLCCLFVVLVSNIMGLAMGVLLFVVNVLH